MLDLIPCGYDNHRRVESSAFRVILPRVARVAIDRALRTAPVTVLLGARQTGKTALVRSIPQLASRPYLAFDDFDLRIEADADPESILVVTIRVSSDTSPSAPIPWRWGPDSATPSVTHSTKPPRSRACLD